MQMSPTQWEGFLVWSRKPGFWLHETHCSISHLAAYRTETFTKPLQRKLISPISWVGCWIIFDNTWNAWLRLFGMSLLPLGYITNSPAWHIGPLMIQLSHIPTSHYTPTIVIELPAFLLFCLGLCTHYSLGLKLSPHPSFHALTGISLPSESIHSFSP